METWIIDWGEDCNGGRYALIQASTRRAAHLAADSIGYPFRIAKLKIGKISDDYPRYLEIDQPKSIYFGNAIVDEFEWEDGLGLSAVFDKRSAIHNE